MILNHRDLLLHAIWKYVNLGHLGELSICSIFNVTSEQTQGTNGWCSTKPVFFPATALECDCTRTSAPTTLNSFSEKDEIKNTCLISEGVRRNTWG